jgi:hypothetical protein
MELNLYSDSTFMFDLLVSCDSTIYDNQCAAFDRGFIELHWKGNFTYTQQYKEFEIYDTLDKKYHWKNGISGEATLHVIHSSDSTYLNSEFKMTYDVDCNFIISINPLPFTDGKLMIRYYNFLPI